MVKISVVSQCRILVAQCSVNEHTAVHIFVSTQADNLHLLDCSVTWSLLTLADKDWTCWLTADTRALKHKHKFVTDWDSGHTVQLPTFSTLLLLLMHQPWRRAAFSAAISCQQHAQEILPMSVRFQETAQSEQHWHSDAYIEGFICHKLKIITECTSCSNMPWRWALRVCSVFLNYKWNNYVIQHCGRWGMDLQSLEWTVNIIMITEYLCRSIVGYSIN